MQVNKIEMYEELYGSYVRVNDRFETYHIWSEEKALRNNGRYVPKLVPKLEYEKNAETDSTTDDNYSIDKVSDNPNVVKLMRLIEDLNDVIHNMDDRAFEKYELMLYRKNKK